MLGRPEAKTLILPRISDHCLPVHMFKPPGRGRTRSGNAGKTGVLESRDPKCDPFPKTLGSDLAKIVAAWPSLPEPIRRAMLALIG